jgi:RNA polymerase sigma-70 factor, ECF subfamily
MELSALIKRCRGGDELAWEVLVRQFQARIYGITYHYAKNAEDARDLAQETFIRIYRHLTNCPDATAFLPWIIRIARNVCIDHLRRKKVRPPDQDIASERLLTLRDPGDDPSQQYAADLRKRVVYHAIQQLSDLNREIILLKDIQGLSLEEVASMLHLPLGTVKSRSNRARIELAKRLALLRSELSGSTVV